MTLSPVIALHLSAALGALALGPVALSLRKGSPGHRAAGYTWITLMLVTALSALFIRDFRLPNLAGYTPIHLLVPFTLISLALAIRAVIQGRIQQHRRLMWRTYLGACVVAGAFTLLPQRMLGQWVWHHALAWI